MTELNLMIPIITGILGAGACIYFLFLKQKNILKNQQQQGINALKSTRNFLALIQRHRGLCNGFHNGDQKQSQVICELQQKISKEILLIQKQQQWITLFERWDNSLVHWSSLHQRYTFLDADSCLLEHNQLINNILYLIEDLAEASRLNELYEDEQRARIILRDLLLTAEYVGQTRALGTGVAASGQCTSVSRIRLNYLKAKVTQGIQNAVTALSIPNQVTEGVEQLLNCLETKLLSEKPTVSSDTYFSVATQALDVVLALYDQEIEHLNDKLKLQR